MPELNDAQRAAVLHAEGPLLFDRARHFLQDDRGPDLACAVVEFLKRSLPATS